MVERNNPSNPLSVIPDVLGAFAQNPGKEGGLLLQTALPAIMALAGLGGGKMIGSGASSLMGGATSGGMEIPEVMAALAKLIGGAATTSASAATVGNAISGSGGDTGASPTQQDPFSPEVHQQMSTLAAQGVPASDAWKIIMGDQPLLPAQAPTWGAAYQAVGGQNNIPSAGATVGGVTPVTPTPTPTPTMPGPGNAGSNAGGGSVRFADMTPDQQALAAAEHGSVPPELAGGNTAPAATPQATPPAGPPAGPPAAPADAGAPTVGAAAAQPGNPTGAPQGNGPPSPELMGYMYDLMNPERAAQNAIGTTGGPQFGPGFDWLKSYLQPAFLHNLAGGNLTPAGLQGALQSRLGGTEQDTAAGTVGALKGFESQGKEALAGNPGSDIRQLVDRAKAGDTTARDQLTSKYGGMGYMAFLGTQDPGAMGGALAQAIAGDSQKPMAPGLAGVLGKYLGDIMTRQVNAGSDVGPNANNRFNYLSGLLGY